MLPLSAFAITMSGFDFSERSASFSSFVRFGGGGFALRRILQTAARAVLDAASSVRLRKTGSTPAIISFVGMRDGAGAKFRPFPKRCHKNLVCWC